VTPFYLVDVFTDRPFTGNPLAIVTDADGFDAARMQRIRSVGAQGCYVFCLDPLDPDSPARARFFGPNVGIAEDPATGSAAGPLAAYLVEHKLASERRPVIVEQGHTMGRPSRIEVRVSGGGVRVWGTAVPVLEGHLKH
jgi:trans-2,3-dihydro-3-hydroxyanthranilate isomerase